VVGLSLLDRARRYGAGVAGRLRDAIQAAERRLGGRAGRIRVACASCAVSLDGAELAGPGPFYARVGSHAVRVESPGRTPLEETVTVRAEQEVLVDVVLPAAVRSELPASSPAPALLARTEQPSSAPLWLFLASTAIAGGAALASGIDTSDRHASFVADGCPGAPSDFCSKAASAGLFAQRRTNVLLGATVVLGVATGVAAILSLGEGGEP
jgi:hypothetical protein